MDEYEKNLLEREQYAKTYIADLRGKVKKLRNVSMRSFIRDNGSIDTDKFDEWSYQYHCSVMELAHVRFELRQLRHERKLYHAHCVRRSKLLKGG